MQNGNMQLRAFTYWYGIGLNATADCERCVNIMAAQHNTVTWLVIK